MLEEAIVDAKALRDAAIKNAETMVVEKYSDEVRTAVEKILEQDLDLEDDLDADPLATDLGDDALAGEEEESSVMGDIPMAHSPEQEDEVVVVDLDQIIAAAEADEGIEDEEFEIDAEEIADTVGIPVSDEMAMEDPANRNDDEIEISEDALLDVFKEMLVVDVDPDDLEKIQAEAEAVEKEEEEEVVVFSSRDDGMDKKDIEAHARLTTKLESITKENKELKNILVKVKDRLEEVNLSNARLLYANRVLQDASLNEQQKNRIAEMLSEVRSADEAKMVYETLQKTMASQPKSSAPQSLSEAVSRKSSVILSGRREEKAADVNPVTNRWATLAGINKS
tara:strand:+ start:1295 stop:2308 length:1014 start_codon:yes stop_codon:yes gene_type:complete